MRTAEERYEYAWQDFQASKERGAYKTLKSYCQSHHINYEGLRYWKRKNIATGEIQPSNTFPSHKSKTGFISISQQPCIIQGMVSISDVQITSPSGLTVHIASLPAEVLLQILAMQKGDVPCSL